VERCATATVITVWIGKLCDSFECNVRSEWGVTDNEFTVRIGMGWERYCILKCKMEEGEHLLFLMRAVD